MFKEKGGGKVLFDVGRRTSELLLPQFGNCWTAWGQLLSIVCADENLHSGKPSLQTGQLSFNMIHAREHVKESGSCQKGLVGFIIHK